MESISEPNKQVKELSVEEIKAMRLCRCGNWKHARFPGCNECHLLFSGLGTRDAYMEDMEKVKRGELDYHELLKHSDDLPGRRALIFKMCMRSGIRISEEDFIFTRKNIERREKKRKFHDKDILHTKAALSKAIPVYRGFNTVT